MLNHWISPGFCPGVFWSWVLGSEAELLLSVGSGLLERD